MLRGHPSGCPRKLFIPMTSPIPRRSAPHRRGVLTWCCSIAMFGWSLTAAQAQDSTQEVGAPTTPPPASPQPSSSTKPEATPGGQASELTAALLEQVGNTLLTAQGRAHADEIISAYPDDPRVRNLKAGILMLDRRFAEARPIYEELLREDPASFSNNWNLAELELLIANYPRSRQLYGTLLEMRPGDPNLLFRIGLTYLLEEKVAEARKTWALLPEDGSSPASEIARAALSISLWDRPTALGLIAKAQRKFDPTSLNLYLDALIETGILTVQDLATANLEASKTAEGVAPLPPSVTPGSTP